MPTRAGRRRFGLALGLMLIALALALALGYWLWDEPLSPEADAWLRAATPEGGDAPGYLYLLGLDAADGDPEAIGRQRLEAYRQRRAGSASSRDAPSPDHPKLARPPRCALPEACRARWADGQGGSPWEAHGELLRRYRQALAYSSYRSGATPGALEPWPDLTYLLDANRLLNAQALAGARSDGAAARDMLERDLASARRMLSLVDLLILKAALLKIIGRDLDSLAWLHQRGLIPSPSRQVPLSDAERSLWAPMRREFAGGAQLFRQGLFDGPPSPEARLERALATLFFKPGMSINRLLPGYRQAAEASRLDARAFARALKTPAPALPEGDWRNRMGNVLTDIRQDWNPFIARFHDLDGKLRLYERLLALPSGEAPDPQAFADLPGLYAEADRPQWDAQAGRLCWPGPWADRDTTRCLDLRRE